MKSPNKSPALVSYEGVGELKPLSPRKERFMNDPRIAAVNSPLAENPGGQEEPKPGTKSGLPVPGE
jgi:hypothetical protein